MKYQINSDNVVTFCVYVFIAICYAFGGIVYCLHENKNWFFITIHFLAALFFWSFALITGVEKKPTAQ